MSMFPFTEFKHKKIWPRLADDRLIHPAEFPLIAFILAFFVGMTLSIPFKMIKEREVKPSMLGSRQELINQIVTLSNEKDDLKDALGKEREQLGKLDESLGKKEQERELLLDRFREASLLAGLRGVKGKGIILHLAETNESIPSTTDISLYLIHQEDLLNITNELWAAGAEAMAIKSGDKIERIVATTAIRCVGPVVRVNNQSMAPPYEILTIGDPRQLREALDMPGGVLQPLQFFRITYSIEEKDEIILPPYSGVISSQYTQPLEEPQEGSNK